MALTLVTSQYVERTSTASTAIVTPSWTPAAGNLLVIKIITGDAGQTFGTPAASGFTTGTVTSRVDVGTSGASCRVGLWTCSVTASAAGTLSSGTFSGTRVDAMCVEEWSGWALAATPATASSVADATSPWTTSITTAQASSVVSYAIGDWNAVDPSTTAFSGDTATPSRSHADTFISGQMSCWWLYQAAATAGAQTIGLSAPSGITTTTAAIEIQDAGGGSTDATVVLQPSQQSVTFA